MKGVGAPWDGPQRVILHAFYHKLMSLDYGSSAERRARVDIITASAATTRKSANDTVVQYLSSGDELIPRLSAS